MKCEFEVLDSIRPIWERKKKTKNKCKYKINWLAFVYSILVISMILFMVEFCLSFRQPSENVNVPEKQINEWWLE